MNPEAGKTQKSIEKDEEEERHEEKLVKKEMAKVKAGIKSDDDVVKDAVHHAQKKVS